VGSKKRKYKKVSSIYCGVAQNGNRWKAVLSYRKGRGPNKNLTECIGTFDTQVLAADAYKIAWFLYAPPEREYKRFKIEPFPKESSPLQLAQPTLLFNLEDPLMPHALMSSQEMSESMSTLISSHVTVESIEALPTSIHESRHSKPLLLDESGDYDLKVAVGNTTLLVLREKLESASPVLKYLMQESTTDNELIISDFPPPAMIAVLLPISVTALSKFEFVEDGDIIWQALMTSCILEIEQCVILFVALLMDDAHRRRQALDSAERTKTARVLHKFSALEGVSGCMDSLQNEDSFWM
jgi:hypothetical protein